MVIAILVAIAIPSFLTYRTAAQNRDAQNELRSVLLAERSHWVEEGEYTATAGDITAVTPNVTVAGAPTDGVFIDVNDADTAIVCLVRVAESGDTFSIWDSATAGTRYGTTDLSTGDCPAVAPPGHTPAGF